MAALPQEIIECIALHADIDTRWNLLTVSRSVQAAVEKVSWSDHYQLKSVNINKFLTLYHDHRVHILRNIIFSIEFPELRETEEELLKCRETIEQIQAQSELFTRQISDLFTALKTLEGETETKNRPSGIRLTIGTPYQRDNGMQHCDHRRYHSWRLRLLNPQNLPRLLSIRTLIIGEDVRFWSDFSCRYERPLDLRVVVDLVSRLPNLETLNCAYLNDRVPYPYEDAVLSHFTHPWEGPRRDARHDFGKAITTLAMPKRITTPVMLKRAKFYFGNVDELGMGMDQSKPLPDLVKPLSFDPLSASLREFSQQLTELDLRICADSSLFWPSEREPDAIPPSWPHLKRLHVEFHPASPSGAWYFQGPRDQSQEGIGYEITEKHYPPVEENEADENWDDIWNFEGGRYENVAPDMFRTAPVDDMIEPLLEAFAKALGSMRSLEEAELFTYLSWCPCPEREQEYPNPPLDREQQERHRWGLRYHTEGSFGRLKWETGDWRPRKALLQRFQRIVPEEQ
jgi:hypothetical protein